MSKYTGESISFEEMQRREMEQLAKEHGVDLENPGMDISGGAADDGMVYGSSTKVTADELAVMTSKMTIDKRYRKKAPVEKKAPTVQIKSKTIKKDKKRRSKNSK